MAWPAFMDGLMKTAPGSIARRYPTYWSDGEGGIDWNPGTNNPIIALADGVVIGAGYFCHAPWNMFMQGPYPCSNVDYGVITTRVTNKDGTQTDLYYQHILIDPKIRLSASGGTGQVVHKGDVIGRTNPGGFIEMGINVGTYWKGIWGNNSPGPHVDPEPYLRALANNYGGIGSFVTLGLGTNATFMTVTDIAHETLNNVPGFEGLVEALDIVEQFQPFKLPDGGTLGRIPIIGSIIEPITLPSDTIQAVLMFIVTNTMAALIRALIIFLGLALLLALIKNATSTTFTEMTGMTPGQAIKTGAEVAGAAAVLA